MAAALVPMSVDLARSTSEHAPQITSRPRPLDEHAASAAHAAVDQLRRLHDDEEVLSTLREHLGLLIDHDQGDLYALDGSGALRRVSPAGDGAPFGVEGSTFERAVQDREPCTWVRLPRPTLPGDEHAVRAGMVTSLILPLLARDVVVGLLVLYSRRAGAYRNTDVAPLAPLGDLVAQLLLSRRIRETERELQRAQIQLAANERLVALGQLSAGIAHEINNPAAYVLTNLVHLTRGLDERAAALAAAGFGDLCADFARVLEESVEGVDRIRRVVADLRAFTSSSDDVQERVDTAGVVRAVVTLCGSAARGRATLVVDLEPTLPCVTANTRHLTLVLQHLVTNAIEACDPTRAEENIITLRAWSNGRHVGISVRDRGVGVACEQLTRIFEPFFTTKAMRGVGLGLSVSRDLAQRMGGTLTVESELGQGSTFTLLLRAQSIAPSIGDPHSTRPHTPKLHRRPTVLIVDDEPGIRRALKRTLGQSSDVVLCESAEEAMERLASGADFDVVISDLLLPGASGAELWEFIARERPELAARVMYVTGGAVSPRTCDFVAAHRDVVLSKPLDPRRLASIVARVAAGTSARRAIRATER